MFRDQSWSLSKAFYLLKLCFGNIDTRGSVGGGEKDEYRFLNKGLCFGVGDFS